MDHKPETCAEADTRILKGTIKTLRSIILRASSTPLTPEVGYIINAAQYHLAAIKTVYPEAMKP